MGHEGEGVRGAPDGDNHIQVTMLPGIENAGYSESPARRDLVRRAGRAKMPSFWLSAGRDGNSGGHGAKSKECTPTASLNDDDDSAITRAHGTSKLREGTVARLRGQQRANRMNGFRLCQENIERANYD
jgi:hypothetical protein